MMHNIGLIGVGFVGGALKQSFELKGRQIIAYDKFKEEYKNNLNEVLNTSAIFLCLPTPFINEYGYDLGPILEVLSFLRENEYGNPIIIKSTIEPGTTQKLADKFDLNLIHNPEFLTERTAFQDFHNQSHIVIGYTSQAKNRMSLYCQYIVEFYRQAYPDARISECTSDESEAMKLFCNNFYAMKVGIANEFNLFCQKMLIDYDRVKQMMVFNGLICDSHLQVPGPDGRRGWGGNCFIKDTKALEKKMQELGCPHEILSAAINENKKIRG